ncbi:MAG: ABC transporter ATP-binding protein/permease [Deltaproteobacteria bacterium]|nr:ABC transporter ATP-binding protein/permease [Deltaproteobacteria bacterium]
MEAAHSFQQYGGTAIEAPKPKKRTRLSGLIRLAGPQKGKLIFSGVLAILGQGCGIVPFFIIYYIVAEIGSKSLNQVEPRLIWVLVFAGIAAIILKHACLGISTTLSHISAFNILYNLRIKIAGKLGTLPLGYFNKKNTGQIKKVMSEDVEHMEIFLAHNIPDFAGAFVYTLLTATVLFVVDWRLALATIIVIPAGIVFQTLPMVRDREAVSKWFSAVENMNAAMIEYIQGVPIIKAFNHTVESFSKYSKNIEECISFEDRMCGRWYLPMSIFSVSLTANMLLLLPVGATMYLSDIITLQKFVLFLLLGIGFGNPMVTMIQFGRLMESNLEGQARIEEVLTARSLSEPDEPETPGKGVFGKRVEFGYDRETRVLKDIDFSVPAGRFVALVGPSGAGKSTLARLIPRFWDVDAGSISLGKTDIRKIKVDDLMDQFGLVFQNVHLLNDTVLANLRIGRTDATENEIKEAAKTARCHEFIMDLPTGYDTIIGEKGGKISGGEKQRLSIARALLKDAPILILDEATAFIDPENEALVQDAINKLVRNKTLIVIAHRISTITSADEISVLDKGYNNEIPVNLLLG